MNGHNTIWSCVLVALIEYYSTLKHLKASPAKSQISSCDNVVANERYITLIVMQTDCNINITYESAEN
jgi:hypothetical protein